ncbi:MAG TPA: hypothetical protein VEV16_05165 [Daejeonella sp.]|nr:hypothetical protein [Daejeonella sp.]
MSKREIKCPECKQWTTWNGNIQDRCLFCNELIEKEAFKKQAAKETLQAISANKRPDIIIHPDDSFLVRLSKRIQLACRGFVYYAQIAFVSVISFILWIIALLAA